jgi:hypothetical protein
VFLGGGGVGGLTAKILRLVDFDGKKVVAVLLKLGLGNTPEAPDDY